MTTASQILRTMALVSPRPSAAAEEELRLEPVRRDSVSVAFVSALSACIWHSLGFI